MKKFIHLSTCSTCKRIIKDINLSESFDLQDIKTENISAEDLDLIKKKVGSYEDLFSKRAQKFRAQNLHEKELSEVDYRNLILEEYTFLKRPVLINGENVFVGNSKKVVEEMANSIEA